jgi:hypothetical protein
MSIIDRSHRRARREIETLLRQGLLSLDQIVSWVGIGMKGEIEGEILERIVRETWARMATAPTKRPTALDRLQAAFDALDDDGVMARHHPVEERWVAQSNVRRELELAEQSGRTYQGYCFYDGSHARMMADGALALCIGPGRPMESITALWRRERQVGERVVAALRGQGFAVRWDGHPGDMVFIEGVAWTGARDAAGAPLIARGARWHGEARPRELDEPTVGTSAFVACAESSPEAHRLLAAIADRRACSMHGSAEAIDSAAAVAVTQDGVLLDLVAGQAGPGGYAAVSRRNLAAGCHLLVVVTPTIDALDCPRWSFVEPERRFVALTSPASAPVHDGSIAKVVEIGTGEGLDDLLRALSAAPRRGPC